MIFINRDDARKLKRLTHQLYHHIYAYYNELEGENETTDESLILDIDIIEKEHEAELAQKDQVIAIKEQTINEQELTIDRQIQTIASKDAEIAKLKAQLAQYSSAEPH